MEAKRAGEVKILERRNPGEVSDRFSATFPLAHLLI
jgi:hypothetical protein